jgi:DNA-binding Lrp family transcriptional regulator
MRHWREVATKIKTKASMPEETKRNLSERDLQLLGALEGAPNATTKELADATSIPPSTVAKRLSKLKDLGVIRSCINRAALEKDFPIKSIIAIKLNSATLRMPGSYENQQEFARFIRKGPWHTDDKFKNIAGLVLVHRVFILLGGEAGDIMLEVSARTPLDLMEFLTKCVHLCPGVICTNTATIGFVA